MKKYLHLAGPVFCFISVISMAVLLPMIGCKKTDSPLGMSAPHGFDFPTLTPTPQTGAIQVYVKDQAIVSSGAVQGVSIVLIEPGGVTFGSNSTQPVVGYAAFNPSNLVSGIWDAVVPAQSISYSVVSSGVTTPIQRQYGTSTLPITITGGGQYSATFATGGNAVALSPVSQSWTTTVPQFIPVTVTYSETGNLDVPVTASMSGMPAISSFTYLNPNTWQLGGSNPYYAAVTISRTACYFQPVTLSLTATDLKGNPIPTAGAVINKGWSIPVTCLICKHSLGSGYEEVLFQCADAATSLSCGASVYSVSYTLGPSDPPGGTVRVNNFPANTASAGISYTGGSDPYVRATFTIPNGQQFVYDIQVQYLAFDSYSNAGTSTW